MTTVYCPRCGWETEPGSCEVCGADTSKTFTHDPKGTPRVR